MNLLLLEPHEVDGDGRARVSGRRADHLRRVLDVAPGDRVRAGIAGGGIGSAAIEAVRARGIDLRLDVAGAPDRPPVDLVLALPRPKALRRVLQTIASLGVGRLDLVNAWKVEKSYFGSPALAPAALREELLLGCEQAGTTWVPPAQVHTRLMTWFAEQRARPAAEARLVLHPRNAAPLESVAPRNDGPGTLAAIGPEGGWLDREVETFAAHGFAIASLGDRVLRVETAVTSLLAQLALLRRL